MDTPNNGTYCTILRHFYNWSVFDNTTPFYHKILKIHLNYLEKEHIPKTMIVHAYTQ